MIGGESFIQTFADDGRLVQETFSSCYTLLLRDFDREVRGAQDRSATHNSANLPDYLDFGVYIPESRYLANINYHHLYVLYATRDV